MGKSSKNPILLASRSPRRSRILKFVGIPFEMKRPIEVEEKRLLGERPERMVRRLAVEKALSVAIRFPKRSVLGADTIVVNGNQIFGKPKNKAEAVNMLRKLG